MSGAGAVRDRMVGAGRWVSEPPGWPPVAGATLGLLALGEVAARAGGTGPAQDGARLSVTLLLGVAATAPLALARSFLVGSAATITAASVLVILTDHRLLGAGLAAQLLVLYLIGFRGPRWAAVVLLVPPVASLAAVTGSQPGRDTVLAVVLAYLGALAIGAGWARRLRGEALARAADLRTLADTRSEHAALGERARIARDLHDVVAHHISMISVQAEVARLTTPDLPQEGARRLVAIAATARAALTEMRRLLGVLREDAAAEPPREPQPGLHRLNELVDEARALSTGPVRLIVGGAVAPLDPGVELTAYRIVQEALTNTRRHAPGAAVDVELRYTPDTLWLRVRDNGPGPVWHPAAAGHGLLGMRERAAVVGGELRARPSTGAGFLVEATLPRRRPDPE